MDKVMQLRLLINGSIHKFAYYVEQAPYHGICKFAYLKAAFFNFVLLSGFSRCTVSCKKAINCKNV